MENNTNSVSILKKQRNVIIVFAVLVVILVVAFLVLPKIFAKEVVKLELPKTDAETGDVIEYDAIRCKDGTAAEVTETDTHYIAEGYSEIIYTARPFIYPQIEVENVKEVNVVNSTGEYALYLDGAAGEHLIRGNEFQPYNEQPLSDLRFQARFMLANERLDGVYASDKELSAFGLDAASNPVKVSVADTSGNNYTVYIGKQLVSGNGYYAKDDDPYVYVLDSSVSVFFNDKNYFINPLLTVPMSQSQYQYADEFNIVKNGEPFISSAIVPESNRSNTGNISLHKLTYPGNYPASFNNYYLALECFANLTGDKVIETNVISLGEENAEAVFEKYGFTVASNDVSVKFGSAEYRFITGSKFTDENGSDVYYAYSPVFDTVVTLPVANAAFLEYELIDFINSNFFQMNITNASEIKFESGDKSYRFVIEGTGNDMTVTEVNTGKTVDAPSFRQLYISLLTAKLEGYAGAEDVTGDKELTFKVKSVFGEETSYSFSVISTTRSLLTLDGSSEFYTARSYVTDIIEKLDKLVNGEIIAPEY